MAEYKFTCPHCGQNIQCNEQWSGQQINCPACSGSIIVPQLAPVPAPAPAPGPIAYRPPPGARAPVTTHGAKAEAKSAQKVVGWSLIAVAFVVLMVFGTKLADSFQETFNKKSKEAASKGGEGELTHMGHIYQVLDATDENKRADRQMRATLRAEKEQAQMMEDLKPKPDPTLTLPVAAAAWTMDNAGATIPKGRVNGTSGGTDFHVESVDLTRSPTASVLAFHEGTGTTTVHEMFIYLPIKPTDDLAGRSWSVTKDTKSKDALQIVKRWTVNPKFMPSEKTFSKGYVMNLELGQPTRDWQPGSIFLALPDTNQTVLAGEFSIPIPRKKVFDLQ